MSSREAGPADDRRRTPVSGRPDRRCYAGVEAGGTKFVCAVGSGPGDLRAVTEIPTRDPESTLGEVIRFFRSCRDSGQSFEALGIASFGPLELNRDAAGYGSITTTPKPGWQNVELVDRLAGALGVPVALDTDVNAAAAGEAAWGAARGLDHFLYVTLGTGVGVGAVVDGRIFHGAHHPEMGHVPLPLSPDEPEGFVPVCPFHGACAEGLASGAAILARWGRRLDELPEEHPAWRLEAGYLADFLAGLTLTLQPERIIVGGGVASEALLALARDGLYRRLAGYRADLAERGSMSGFLMLPGLDRRAGVVGAVELARHKVNRGRHGGCVRRKEGL